VPGLDAAGLKGAVRYYDGFTNDARLVLDTLRSAARHGAGVVNYCRFDTAARGEFWECRVTDLLTGGTHKITARAVVNATGPWSDRLPHSGVRLRLTKGIHLVLDHSRLPVPDTVVMTEGKRILFAIPWGERTILGTTDTDYHGAPEDAGVEEADTSYLLGIANRFFPGAQLVVSDIVSAWSGVRPLIADTKGRPADISRAHEIKSPAPGWWDVAGGKLTTYRLMAEQTVDAILRAHPRSGLRECRTAHEPLLPAEETKYSGVLPPEFARGAVEHFVAHEWAVHLDDVMTRRTSWRQYGPDWQEKAEEAGEWMGELLGWDAARRTAERDRCRQLRGWTSAH